MPIDSGYELLGSPILIDTRTLMVQRQGIEWKAAEAFEDPYNLFEFYL
jgi:hypothetical protein